MTKVGKKGQQTKDLFVKEAVQVELELAEEKLRGMVAAYQILSLQATIAKANFDMGSLLPSTRAIARADKAKAEIALARIEISKLKWKLD